MISINNTYYRGIMEKDELVIYEWNHVEGEYLKTEIVRLGNNNYEGLKKLYGSDTKNVIFAANLVSIEYYIRRHKNLPLPKRFERIRYDEVNEMFAFVETREEYPGKWACYYYEDFKDRRKKYYALINDGEEIPEPYI